MTAVAAILFAGFLAGWGLTYLLLGTIRRVGMLDVPNQRSSHSTPVPRGGGLAIVFSFIAFLVINSKIEFVAIDDLVFKALVAGGAIVAVVGFLDDLNHIPAKWRFLTHTLAVVVSLVILPSLPEIPILGFEFNSYVAVLVVLAISLVWFINLYNFMDGTDGIAGVEAITSLGGGALILAFHGESNWPVIFGFLGLCIAGFLVWNWSPAKVFMGDACSGFLGFTLGLIAIATSTGDAINVWSWVILFGIFIADSTTTLVIRISRGDEWYAAHRSHAYQILSRRWGSHSKVAVVVLLVNLMWLMPLAFAAASYPFWSLPLCVIALMPLAIVVVKVGAGRPEIAEL